MTDIARQFAQNGLLWAAGNMEVWSPIACLLLLGAVVGLVHLGYELATSP